jgi:hypothetical protein
MPTIRLIPCILCPRIDQLADYIAGLLAIQRHGIPQTVNVHPADLALIAPQIS